MCYGKIVECPFCGAVLDRQTLYRHDCICLDCGGFIDPDNMITYDSIVEWEYDNGMYAGWDDSFYNDYDYYDDDWYYKNDLRKYKEHTKKDKEERGASKMIQTDENKQNFGDGVMTLVMRFLVNDKVDFETISNSFEAIGGDVDFISCEKIGKIKADIMETAGGKKLATGLHLDIDKYDEYYAQVTFFTDGNNGNAKKAIISTLCHAFPILLLREEESGYIMSNNKGLAKAFVDSCGEDQIEMMAQYLSGFEKYKILCNYLYYASAEFRKIIARDIFIKWENDSLISLDTLRKKSTEVPLEWQVYLADLDGVMVSKDDKDPGAEISFEEMLEDCLEHAKIAEHGEIEDLIQVISLRGTKAYTPDAGAEEGDDDIDTEDE